MNMITIAADVITIFIVVVFVWVGITKGFIKSLFRLVSVSVSVFLSKLLFPYTKMFLETIFVKDLIKSFVINKLNLTSATKEITEYSVNALNLPDFIKTAFLNSNYLKGMQNDASATLAGTISEFVANYCVTMLSYVITFIIVGLAIYFILVLLNVFSKLPIINFCNAGLGGAMGFLMACIIIWIILTAINIFLVNPNMQYVFDSLDKSIVCSVFYRYNPIVYLISTANGGL